MALVRLEQVRNTRTQQHQLKPVLYFRGAKKGLILSAHNAHTIGTLYGPETEEWVGRRITLYVERGVEAFGRFYDVVRVRPVAPPSTNGTGVDTALPADEDELEAGLVEEEELEPALTETEPRTPQSQPQRQAAARLQATGHDEAPASLRRECTALIDLLHPDERRDLVRSLESLATRAELARFRRFLWNELDESRRDAGRGGDAWAQTGAVPAAQPGQPSPAAVAAS
jgi:hypothetical protein